MTTMQKAGIVILVLSFIMMGFVLSVYSSRIVEFTGVHYYSEPTSEPSPVIYDIEAVDDERYSVTLKNTSITPVYFLAYESTDIEEKFDEFAIRYALRPEVSYNGKLVVSTSYGFDCGTGLVYVMIRPFETVSDTINLQEKLNEHSRPYSYCHQLNDTTIRDKMTGDVFPLKSSRQELRAQMASGLPVTVRFSMQLFRDRNYISSSEEIELCREL